VSSHWSEHREDEEDASSTPYYYNDISGEVRWDAPRSLRYPDGGDDGASSSSDTDGGDEDGRSGGSGGGGEGEAPRVMPPQRTLAAAGRWDLVQAVIAHGGSRQVASDLGWVPAPRWVGRHLTALDALADELRAFCADAGTPGDMPTYAALRGAGREDLAAAVARHGGGAAVAARLGLTLRRSPRGRWAARAAAVAELRAFIRKREPRAAARKCLPTRTELEVRVVIAAAA
jgi:hypothetical protein